MHIQFKRSLRGDYGRARAGDVKLVEPDVGKSLVQRGLAVEVDEAAAKAAEKAAADKVKAASGAEKGQAKAAAAKAD